MARPEPPIRARGIELSPVPDSEQWQLSAPDAEHAIVAHWGEWVRMAQRILDADARRRDLEARGDAWDLGHAAGAADDTGAGSVNPFR